MRYLTFVVVACAVSFSHHWAHAQNFGSTTTNGLFGQRTVTGPTQNQGSAFGSSRFGNSALGSTGQSAFGQGQQGLGQQQQGQQGFLGAGQAQGVDLFSRAQTQQQTNIDSGLQNFLSQAAQRDFQNQSGGGNSRVDLRPKITLGFARPNVDAAVFSERITQRLQKTPSLGIVEGVEVSLVGQTALIRGRVATDHDAEMIARIAMLEPGVNDVQNELNVGVEPPQPATGQTQDVRPAPPIPNDSQVIPIPPPIPEGVLRDAPTAPRADD